MFGKISTYILMLLTVLLCVIALMLSTPWGSQLTVMLLNKITPLTLVYKDGIILEDLTLARLSMKQPEFSLEIRDANIQLTPRCIWQQKLCIKALDVQSLTFTQHAEKTSSTTDINKQADSEAENKAEAFAFPFYITTKHLYIKQANIALGEIAINGQEISTGLVLDEANISLKSPKISRLQLAINGESDSKTSANDNAWPLAALPNINLPFTLSIEQAALNKFVLQPQDKTAEQQLNNSQFSLFWQANALNIKHFTTSHADYGVLTLQGNANFIAPYQLELSSSMQLNNIESLALLKNTKQNIQLSGDLAKLAITAKLEGDTSLSVQGMVDLTKAELPFTSELQIKNIPQLNTLLSATTPVVVTITADGDINRQQISASADISAHHYHNAQLKLNASHQQDKLTVKSLIFKDAKTDSSLNLQGHFSYRGQPSWQVQARSAGFTLPQLIKDDLALNGRLSGDFNVNGENNELAIKSWAIKVNDVAFSGDINGNALTANGSLDLNSLWQLKPSVLSVRMGESKLAINGFSDEQWHVAGVISVPKVEELLADSRGELASTFMITGERAQPQLQISSQLSNLYWQNIASPNLQVQANYQPLKNHALNLAITAEKIDYQATELLDFKAKIVGDYNQQQIDANWLGDITGNISLNGQWLAELNKWQAQVNKAVIGVKDKQWQANKEFALSYLVTNNSFAVEKHCWHGKSVKLCAANDITITDSGKITLFADINLIDIGDIFIPDDIHVTTQLNNEITVAWAPNKALSWDVKTQLSAGEIKLLKQKDLQEQPITLSWQKGEATFYLSEQILSSHLLLSPQKTNQAAILDLNTKVDFAKAGELTGKINVDNLNLFFLQGYLSEISELNGLLNANVTIDGTLTSPNFYGKVGITETAIKAIRSTNSIHDLAINIELMGKQAELLGKGFINTDSAEFTGNINWQEQLSAQLNITADRLSLAHPPLLKAVIAPRISGHFYNNTLKITGEIDVKEGSLTINKLPEGSVSLSDDIIIVNDSGEEVSPTTRFALETDIKLNIADTIKISGYDFNGLLGGKLLVKQQAHQALQLFGNLTIVDGLYRAYGQRLAVNNGRISFNGPVDNPSIDLKAVRYISKENITAGIEIYGPANSLSVNLFSKPTKSKAEILSYILRGRGIDTKTTNNNGLGVTLGATLASASGVVEQLEKLPLINNIEIDGDEKFASIAGYVDDNIYLKYGVGVTEPVNELTVRFYLLNRLWLETVSGIERSADLYFSFDVD
ncbi:MAG: translocation/assembly module TamB domain-containing protein [Thalassotalea sp.]